jgi:5-methylthioadenosine/S-adenosylhomocysteine deaminase
MVTGMTSRASPASGMLAGALPGTAVDARVRLAAGRRVDITWEAGRITAIAPASRRAAATAGVVDGRDAIVFPGMVNAHVHSNESFEQGAYDAAALEEWLVLCYPPLAGEKVAPRLDYLRAMMIAMQSLRSGVTALHDDFLNPGGDPARLAAVFDAYADIGIRAAVACTFADRPYLDGLADGRALCPPALAARLDALPSRTLAAQVRFHERAAAMVRRDHGPRLSLTLGPRGPQRCTPKLMRAVAELAAAQGLPVHMHVLESRAQWLAGMRQHGKSLVRVLEECGLLCERLTMNHAIWLDADDIARMAAHGVSTVHNPMSNFKLSSGLSPVKRLLKAGINVALGSDGPATGDSPDYMQSVRFAALVHKLDLAREAEAPDAATVLRMATANGARTMGAAPGAGTLAVGAPADFTLMRADDPAFTPLNHAARQWAYSAGAGAVRAVIVDGEPVFDRGRFTRIDAAAIGAEIREAAARFRREVMGRRGAANRDMLPFIRKVVANAKRGAAAAPTVNRVRLG